MFHIVYSRHYWNHDEQGQFTNTHTIMRNVPYDNLHKHSSALEGYKITSDINTLIKKYEIMINKHEQQENA